MNRDNWKSLKTWPELTENLSLPFLLVKKYSLNNWTPMRILGFVTGIAVLTMATVILDLLHGLTGLVFEFRSLFFWNLLKRNLHK